MKCRRAFETDLVAVLRGEGGDVEFLAHYPTCADCAAELRVWGELDAMLRAGAPATTAAHPSEETLLAFVDAPTTLAADARAEVERHLAGCRTCADEVGSLRHFEPARAGVPAAAAVAPTHADVPRADGPRETGWLGRLVWQPAFAYALVAALLVPLVRSQLERLSVPAQLAESERASDVRPEVAPGGRSDDQPAAVGAAAPAARSAPATALEPVAPAPVATAPAEEGRARQMAAAQDARRENESDRADLAMRKLASPDAAGGKEQVAEKKAEAANENVPAESMLADHVAQPPAVRYRRGPDDPTGLAAPAAGAPRPPGLSALTPSIEIRAGIPATITFMVALRGPLLHIMTPDFGAGPLDVDVHVHAIAGNRELTRRITSRANTIALQIPPDWLAAGDYTITVAPVAPPRAADADGELAAAAPMTFGFAVLAPETASGAR